MAPSARWNPPFRQLVLDVHGCHYFGSDWCNRITDRIIPGSPLNGLQRIRFARPRSKETEMVVPNGNNSEAMSGKMSLSSQPSLPGQKLLSSNHPMSGLVGPGLFVVMFCRLPFMNHSATIAGGFTAAMAGALINRKVRQMLRRFREHGATRQDRAVTLQTLGERHSWIFRRLVGARAIVAVPEGRYDSDEIAAGRYRHRRMVRALVAAGIVVLLCYAIR